MEGERHTRIERAYQHWKCCIITFILMAHYKQCKDTTSTLSNKNKFVKNCE